MLADRDGGLAVALLLFGLVVTFGSVAMGTAIMALGGGGPRGGRAKGARKDDPFATFSEWQGAADEKAYAEL